MNLKMLAAFVSAVAVALAQVPADDTAYLVVLRHQPVRHDHRRAAAEIQAAILPEQEMLASRLIGLGATHVRRYSTLNMVEATIPSTAVDLLLQDASIAALVPVGANQSLLDQVEQGLSKPENTAVPFLEKSGTAFAALIDRIIENRDLLIAAAPDTGVANALPPGLYSPEKLAARGTLAHLPVKATQLNHSPHVFSDSVSTAGSYRFYSGRAHDPLRSTLVWDRHVDDNFQPYTSALDVFVYQQTDGAQADSSELQDGNVKQAALSAGGDLVVKVKLQPGSNPIAAGESFALALSEAGFSPADGPKLTLRCFSDCIVSNEGDLPAFDAIASVPSKEIGLGVIPPSSSARFPNPGGTVTVSSRSFGEILSATSPPASDPCSNTTWTIGPVGQLNPSGQYAISVSVAPPSGLTCTWMVWTGPTGGHFIYPMTPGGAPVTGPGIVTITADANLSSGPRSETVYVTRADMTSPYASFQVTQAGASTACTFSSPPTSMSLPFSGGPGTLNITANQSTCSSSVLNDSPAWLTLTQPDGTGTRTVYFSASPNTSLNGSSYPRSATLTVQGYDSGKLVYAQTFGVQEAGLGCAYTLSPSVLTLPAAGITQSGAARIAVTTSAAACQWTASSPSSAVHLAQSGTPSTGNGQVLFWVDANNTGADRTATIQIGDQKAEGVQGSIKDPPTTFGADGTVTPPPQPQPVIDLTQVTVELDTYPGSSGKITAKIDPKTGKWQVAGLLAGRNYQAIVILPPALARDYDTLPLSIDNVTLAHSTNLNFRILKKPHGLYVGKTQITQDSPEYQKIAGGLAKMDPNLGVYAKLILDALIASAYNHKYATLQDLINEVAYRALHIRAARDLGKQLDSFNSSGNTTCDATRCKDFASDGDGGIKNANKTPPSKAIQDIFTANMKAALSFECATAQLIANYKAQLDYLGAKAFDAAYANGIDVNKSVWPGVYDKPSPWEPLPGDGIAFNNPASRIQAALNENTLFLGGDQYYGHGLGSVDPANPGVFTSSQVLQKLQDIDTAGGQAPSLNSSALKPWPVPNVNFTLGK